MLGTSLKNPFVQILRYLESNRNSNFAMPCVHINIVDAQ